MRPQAPHLVLGCQTVAYPKKQQDVGGLSYHQSARFQERWRKRRPLQRFILQPALKFGLRATRYIAVVGAGLLQRKTYELPAALYRRPVKKLIAHTRLRKGKKRWRLPARLCFDSRRSGKRVSPDIAGPA